MQVNDAGSITSYLYDPFGNMIQEVTPEGTINYVYDPATQLHTETWTGTSHSSAMTDILYGYDQQRQLASVTQAKINGSTPPATVSGGILYNADGVASSTTLPTTLYTYDNVGNLLSVTDNGNSSGSSPATDTTSYTYDSQNRLTDEVIKNSAGNTIFSEHYVIGDNGLRSSVRDIQYTSNGTTVMSDTTTAWTYDNMGRLLTETSSITGGAQQYQDTYTYDLDSNRLTKTHFTAAGTEITSDFYNGDDQLTSETDALNGSLAYSTANTYDNNGSLTVSITGSVTTTYTYDVRNKMVGYSNGSASATYVYDDNGNRVQETVGGITSYYLTETNKPTGYAQPIEVWTSATGIRSSATLSMTYVLGEGVIAQISNGTLSYLLTDGHGSTRALISSSGAISSNGGIVFNYDASGAPLNFTASSAGTVFLFGGDAVYDAVSGLYINGDGVRFRLGFRFIQMDTYAGSSQDPISLHKYLYADADPINYRDPSGHSSDPYGVLEDSAYSYFQSVQQRVMQNYNDWVSGSSDLSLSDQAFSLAGLVSSEYSVQALAIQSVAGTEFGVISEKTKQNWDFADLQWEGSPEGSGVDYKVLLGIGGEGLIGFASTWAAEGWRAAIGSEWLVQKIESALGLAEEAGESVEGALAAAEAAGELTEAIDILVVVVLV